MALLYTARMTWNYWVFVMGTVGLTVAIGYGTYTTARLLKRWQPDTNLLLTPAENLMRGAIVLVCVALGYLSGLDFSRLGWQLLHPWREIGIGVMAGVGLAFFFYATTRWIVQHSGERFYSTVLLQAILPQSHREFLLLLAALIPVVLLEELLFRSLLLGGLSPLLPAPLLLVGLSLVFGLLHSPQGPWGMIGAGLGGFLFGLLFLWLGSLLAPLVAHYVANALQIGIAWRLGRAIHTTG